jgi:predicted permease
MRIVRIFFLRLAGLFDKERRERDLAEEMESNFELHVADNVRAGMNPMEARRQAMLKLGGIDKTKEEYRDQRSVPMIETLVHDLRYGFRMLRRSPGFTAVAVLSLALGIGANTAIFSFVDALLLRPLPVQNPRQLVTLKVPDVYVVYPWFERLQALTQIFSDAAAFCDVDRTNVTIDGATDGRQVRVGLVTGNYFSLLGVSAAFGRAFTPEDDRGVGGHPVAVLSHDYWRHRFGTDTSAVGRVFTMNGTAYTILGVTPRGFRGEWVGRPTDIWIPVAMASQVMSELRPNPLRGYPMGYIPLARLRPGVTPEQARAVAGIVISQLQRESVGPNPAPAALRRLARSELALESAASGYSPQRRSFSQPLMILTMMAGLVLLIACTNIANLLLARSAARRREIGVRLAIGASAARITKQLLTESVLLAMLGGMLGLALAQWATNILATFVSHAPMSGGAGTDPVILDLQLDGRVLAFTVALCLLTGILFGLAPAFRASGLSLSQAIGTRGGDSGSLGRRFGLSKILVISQVAFSLVLLIGAGMFVRTLRNLKTQDLGVDREHVLLVWIGLLQSGHPVGPPMAPLFETVQDRISSLPGVVSASPSVYGLLNGSPAMGADIHVPGYVSRPGEDLRAIGDLVMPRYFETLGMRLLLGRDFTSRDNEKAPRVAIINESMAQHFFGRENPVGKHFGIGSGSPTEYEIVGVVSDAKLRTPYDHNQMVRYRPYRQDLGHLLNMCLGVRAAGSPGSIAASVRRELQKIDPSLPLLRVETVDEQLDDALVQERLVAVLAGFFGALAVLLACLGLYGVMSYLVTRRTNEIGIRMALGATRFDVIGAVLKECMLMVFTGIAIGVPTALASTRLISTKLFGISTTDPLTLTAATALLIAVAVLAGFVPALRASRVDPMVALRCE